MNKTKLFAVWVLPSLVLLTLTSQWPWIRNALALVDDERFHFAEQQSLLIKRIKAGYIEEVQEKDLYEGALKGMVESLGDPYSVYLTEKAYKNLMEDSTGSYSGIGISIDPKGKNGIRIVSTLEGSPAFTAGLLPGDMIMAVDAMRVGNMDDREVISRIKGPKGKKVTLTVLHDGAKKEVDIDVVRAKIEVPSVQGTEIVDKKSGIGYIRISSFDDDTDKEVAKAMEALLADGARSVILDVRSNGGGDFKSCRRVIDLFVAKGKMVSTVGRRKAPKDYPASRKTAVGKDFRIVVLINRWSASASEVLAAALQDMNHRATVVGVASFGKGSVQEIIRLDDKGKTALKLTTAYWLRPNGKRTTKKNPVVPDEKVEIAAGHWKELMRKRALGKDYKRPDTMKEDPVDTQLAKAIELLKKP